MLKEYDQLWAQARHIDEQAKRVPRFFLIVVGATLAAGAAISQFAKPDQLSFTLAGAVFSALGFIGLAASLTIPRFRVIRNSYFAATYYVRKYFKERSAELERYLWFPTEGTFRGYFNPLRNDFFRFMMMVLMDTSLVGIGLYLIQNSAALATEGVHIRWLPWAMAVEVVVFAALHTVAYFGVIAFYHREDVATSKRLDNSQIGEQDETRR